MAMLCLDIRHLIFHMFFLVRKSVCACNDSLFIKFTERLHCALGVGWV